MSLTLDLPADLGLGQEATALTFAQISLRGVIVFIATLAIIRCGDRRFLSQKTALHAVLGFILASMLARAVNESLRADLSSAQAQAGSPSLAVPRDRHVHPTPDSP